MAVEEVTVFYVECDDCKSDPKQTVRWPDIYLDALRQSLTMPNFITTHPKDSYTFRRVEPSDGEAK